VLLLSLGLTSLAVGLGAMFPEMKEDNPARIANGLGGTLNIVLSLFYLGVVLLMEAVPAYLYSLGILQGVERFLLGYIAIFLLINLVVITLPLYMGIRRWQRTEF
jgi:ABC-2 type transport system permease protein